MHLVKWIRKNQRKLMAFVVIFIMVGFVGGNYFIQMLGRIGQKEIVIATYRDGGKITPQDRNQARIELEILQNQSPWCLNAASLLYSQLTLFRTPDYRTVLLGQLLFPESQTAMMINSAMKEAVFDGQMNATTEQIDEFFNSLIGISDINWILLKAEARKAGCVISNDQARATLKRFIPAATQGTLDAAKLINSMSKSTHMTENRIIDIFADFLAVLSYTKMITDNENVTINQVRSVFGRNGKRISTEFVKFPAEKFAAEQTEPTDQQVTEHFEKYKNYFPGEVDEENIYGFGYKIAPAIQLEYLVVKLEDVEKIITPPTDEDMVTFYQRNLNNPAQWSKNMFKYEKRTDPNDPDSAITVERTYAEVELRIKQLLVNERKDTRAEMIINDAIDIVQSAIIDADLDLQTATVDQLRALAGDYTKAAAQLGEKHKIKVHVGKTDLLTHEEFTSDRYLNYWAAEGQNQNAVPLPRIAFAIEEIGVVKLSRFDMRQPKMWQDIGSLTDGYTTVALVRIIDAKPASVPANANETFGKKAIILTDNPLNPEKPHSVKDAVTKDIKLLSAMETAKIHAEEFKGFLADKSWAEAVTEYNELHPLEGLQALLAGQLRSEKRPDQTRRTPDTDWTRRTPAQIKMLKTQMANRPADWPNLQNMIATDKLIGQLDNILGKDQDKSENINHALGSDANLAWYVIKDISKTMPTKQDYQAMKLQSAYMFESSGAQNMALIYLRPDNLFKRMNVEWTKFDKPQEEEETKDETEEQPATEAEGAA